MVDYYNVTTNTGDAEIAAAIASNTKLAITHIAFGDGNGAVPTPTKTRTTLVREVHRQAVTKYERHPTNANWIVIETIIPSNIGGFWVREMGVIANGKMISHGSHAPFEKVADPTGVSEYRLKFTQNIKDGNVVNITLDQSLIYASQAWTDENYVPRDEIIDNLTTDDALKPVSAKQAKNLQDNKLGKTENSVSSSKLAAADIRDLKPTDIPASSISGFFCSINGSGAPYVDVLALNTFVDYSGGMMNMLLFNKSKYEIKHYQADFGSDEWLGSKTLAYAEDVLAKTGGTVGGLNISSSGGNPALQMGNNGTPSTPFIDFSSSGNDNDYDSRIIAGGGNGSTGKGVLTYIAASHEFHGPVYAPSFSTNPPAVVSSLQNLGDGSSARIKIGDANTGTSTGTFLPWIHGISASVYGYRQHNSFGMYRGTTEFTGNGFYMAVGGSDLYPTEAFLFTINGNIRHTSGAINLAGNADTATKLSTATGVAPSFAARATVNFNGTTGEIRFGQNVASVTRLAGGTYQINFINPMNSADFVVASSLTARGDAASLGILEMNAWWVKVRANYGGDNTAGSFDPTFCCVSIFC